MALALALALALYKSFLAASSSSQSVQSPEQDRIYRKSTGQEFLQAMRRRLA
jgi:hypothetical protein